MSSGELKESRDTTAHADVRRAVVNGDDVPAAQRQPPLTTNLGTADCDRATFEEVEFLTQAGMRNEPVEDGRENDCLCLFRHEPERQREQVLAPVRTSRSGWHARTIQKQHGKSIVLPCWTYLDAGQDNAQAERLRSRETNGEGEQKVEKTGSEASCDIVTRCTMLALRLEIDALDAVIVALLARRVCLARRILNVKRRAGLPARSPIREQLVLAGVRRLAAEEGLDPATAERIFRLLIEAGMADQEASD